MPTRPELRPAILLSLVILVVIAALYLSPPPRNIATPSFVTQSADLNNDSYSENYTLENGQLTITENSRQIWQTPPEWHVDSFVLADSTNDGITNINLSVWKPGNFGSSRPFWVKENDPSIKNHFFVFRLEQDLVKPVWQSSNLPVPNLAFKIYDVDGDQRNELVVIEGDYAQPQKCQGTFLAFWRWNGWGFSNEWRSQSGNFCDLDATTLNAGR